MGIGHLNGPGTYPGDLDRGTPTVAERLRQAGYATYMVGKWHVTPWPGPGHNHPRRRGFDRFYGILASIRSYYSPPSLMRDEEPLPPPDGDYHFTDALSDAAAAFVRELASLYDGWAARSGVKPWTEPRTEIGGRR